MKKIIITISLFITLLLNVNSITALSQSYDDKLIPYLVKIEEINHKYNTSYYILDANEFYTSEIKENFESNHDKYIQFITSQDINIFSQTLIKDLQYVNQNVYDVKLDCLLRSSYGSKTVPFFNGNNKMTLNYKYSGSTFDTSYKPSVTVSRINSIMFFEMSSYTGKFMNSNKTYSVTANGRVITTTGIANNKSYTVNFNL